MVKNTKSPARGLKRAQANVPKFDKLGAVKVIVPVSTAGVVPAESITGLTDRMWLEWHPRQDVTGSDRRAFVGRVTHTTLNDILGSGDKLPRKGMSCCLRDRRIYVCGPGSLHVWHEPTHTADVRAEVKPTGPNVGPGQTLTALIADS